jgi:hypothetical protein
MVTRYARGAWRYMSKLEELQINASVQGILPNSLVSVVSVQWFGDEALELTYKDPAGKVANELLYRHDEPRIEVVARGQPWSFDGARRTFTSGSWRKDSCVFIRSSRPMPP